MYASSSMACGKFLSSEDIYACELDEWKCFIGYSHDRQIHVHRKVAGSDIRGKVTIWIHTAALDDMHICIFECFTDQ